MTEQSVYEQLAARFPTEDHRKVNKGGGDQTYVPAEKVIERLNRVLGVAGWSFEVVREGFTSSEAWVLGEITATIDGVVVKRQQYGNEPITMGRSEKSTSDLMKKAGTDSLKKAATLLGVAAYLYDEDERREVEADMREARRTPRPAAPSKDVAAAAAVTGAPTPINNERAELVTALEKGIAYARKIGLDPALPPVADMSNADLQETVDALRTQCRLVLDERKKQGA